MAPLSDAGMTRYLSRIAFRPLNDACWLWLGATSPTGYGHLRDRGINFNVHTVLKELVDGPCPDGLERDHVCHNRDGECPGGNSCVHRRCVRPSHIEYVTTSANARGRLRMRCKYGHVWTPESTQVDKKGWRHCRWCENAKQRRYTEARTGRAPQPRIGPDT